MQYISRRSTYRNLRLGDKVIIMEYMRGSWKKDITGRILDAALHYHQTISATVNKGTDHEEYFLQLLRNGDPFHFNFIVVLCIPKQCLAYNNTMTLAFSGDSCSRNARSARNSIRRRDSTLGYDCGYCWHNWLWYGDQHGPWRTS